MRVSREGAALVGVVFVSLVAQMNAQYLPEWDSIDRRPLPTWYDEAKIGIFIHWGVYSVPSVSNEWFGAEWFEWAWKHGHTYPSNGGEPGNNGSEKLKEFMTKNYRDGTTYADLARDLTGEFFYPDQWVDLFKKAGAKYVVLTSKHHEGFSMWPTEYSYNWNSVDVGLHRDVVGELANAIRQNSDMHFGIYYSLADWTNPLWWKDKRNDFQTSHYVDTKSFPQLKELVEAYKPDVIWGDGEWAPDKYWRSEEFLAWLYNDSPVKDTVVVNDRWGWDTMRKHGGYYSGEDRWNPGELQDHKFENCYPLDEHSWGYRRDVQFHNYLPIERVLTIMVETISCGGNVLINVQPTKEGTITMIEQERLLQLGEWLGINGNAIYGTVAHSVQKDSFTPGIWYTSNASKTTTYAIMTTLPDISVQLGSVPYAANLRIQLLGSPFVLTYRAAGQGIIVDLPRASQVTSKWVWTLSITTT